MADGRHFENRKIAISMQPLDRFWWNLALWRILAPDNRSTVKILYFRKSKTAAAILKNHKNRDISAAVWPIFTKLGTMVQNGSLNHSLTHTRTHARTHTHTHTPPFNGPLSGRTRVSRHQKGKINLDFTEARNSEWQWNPCQHPTAQFFTGRMPFLPPNQQCQTVKNWNSKVKNGRQLPFWKPLNHQTSATFWLVLIKFGTAMHVDPQRLT